MNRFAKPVLEAGVPYEEKSQRLGRVELEVRHKPEVLQQALFDGLGVVENEKRLLPLFRPEPRDRSG